MNCRYIPQDPGKAIGSFYTPVIPEDPEPFDESKPERQLIAQMVSFAINEAFSTTNFDHDIRRDAQNWIKRNDPDTPFTFSWSCIILNLDPEAIREVIKEGKYRFETNHRFRTHQRGYGKRYNCGNEFVKLLCSDHAIRKR